MPFMQPPLPHFSKTALAVSLSLLLATGCSRTLDRLENIGSPPTMSETNNPTDEPEYKPMTWPLPEQNVAPKQYAGSLWQTGSRHFFRDQRAARVGDIIRVNVAVQDSAEVENRSQMNRNVSDEVGAPNIMGLNPLLGGILPGPQDPENFLSIESQRNNQVIGLSERAESITTQIAALVTQVLPNGNMVIRGSQEMRVDFELRQIEVSGVIRPQDIDADNTIDSSQIAQARISYGGRGHLTELNQPRYGQQILDVISPF